MSSGRLFLDRVARQQSPSPLHRQRQIIKHWTNRRNELSSNGNCVFSLVSHPRGAPQICWLWGDVNMSASRSLSPSNRALIQDLESFRSFTMAHPKLVQAKDELLSAIEASAPGSLILVIGPTGVGNSTLRRKVESALIEKWRPRWRLMLAESHSSALRQLLQTTACSNWRDHYQRMLAQIQEPAIEHKLGLERGRVTVPATAGTLHGQEDSQAISCSSPSRTPSSIAARPRYSSMRRASGRIASGRKLADQLDVIKSTASRSHTVHVLIGTYELLAFRNLSAQLSRRSVDLHFSRYRTKAPKISRSFRMRCSHFRNSFDPAISWI